MSGTPRLLFVSLARTAFVQDDEDLLRSAYAVRPFVFGTARRPDRLLWSWTRQLAWLLRELPRAELLLGWFADYHLVLPVALARRFGVPTAVVLGGFDAHTLPTLRYGVYASPWRAPMARFVLRNASLLLPVSGALIEGENPFALWPQRLRTGVRAHVPGLRTPFRVIPTGYDPVRWPLGPLERAASLLTVAYIGRERSVLVKGVDLFLEAARRLPRVPFYLVGLEPRYRDAFVSRWRPPENVLLEPPRPRSELGLRYRQCAVYAQLSRTEGLPNVLCEAMLSGCVPVGSPVGGIPELLEGVGWLVSRPDPQEIAEALSQALRADPENRLQARARILERYGLENRRKALLEALEALRAGSDA